MGGKERGSPQASGVGPGWVGVLMSRWSPAGSSQAHGIRYSGKARPLAQSPGPPGLGLLPSELAQVGDFV